MAEEQRTFLKTLADRLVEWDRELDIMRNKMAAASGERKEQMNKMFTELKGQRDQVRAKIEEYRKKSPEELKAEGEQFLRTTSGKIAEGLKQMASFFEGKANQPPTGGGGKPQV